MSRKQLTAPMISPLALRSGSMLSDTMMRVPSARSTRRSRSRAGLPEATTSAKPERLSGVPSRSKKRTSAVNCSWVCPGWGARPQICTARWLYCRMTPAASHTKVAIGSMSRMPSEARRIASSAGDIDGARRVFSFESSIRTPPRVARQSPLLPRGIGHEQAVFCQAEGKCRLRRGFRGARRRLAADPVVDEGGKPVARGKIVHGAVGDVLVALFGSRQFHAVGAAYQPAIHHGVRDLGMELQGVAGSAAECLDLEGLAFSQQLAVLGQFEALAVPLIDVVGPFRGDGAAGGGRTDGVVADFGVALRVRVDAGAEMARHHLRAEADAEERFVVAQRHADPVDLALDEVFLVIGALRAAEDGGGGMLVHGLRQRIAETRAADVERVAELGQDLADAARLGMFLMQDDEDRLEHSAVPSTNHFAAICKVLAAMCWTRPGAPAAARSP